MPLVQVMNELPTAEDVEAVIQSVQLGVTTLDGNGHSSSNETSSSARQAASPDIMSPGTSQTSATQSADKHVGGM